MKKHRNSQKRIFVEDCVYFVTSKTFGNYPYFKEGIFCDLFVENLRLCKQLKEFDLYAWFLGYDHFHLLIKPNDKFNYSKIMKSLKENVSYMINKIIESKYEGATLTSRLRRIDDNHFKISKLTSKFLQKHGTNHNIPIFQWQKSFRDHYIRNENDFNKHFDYVIRNPQKHHMSEKWKYISTNPIYQDLINGLV